MGRAGTISAFTDIQRTRATAPRAHITEEEAPAASSARAPVPAPTSTFEQALPPAPAPAPASAPGPALALALALAVALASAQVAAQAVLAAGNWDLLAEERHGLARTMDLGFERIVNVNIEVPEHVARVARELEARGHRAYVVGGAVRDSLLGRTPRDWDICTSATPDEVEDVFGESAVPTGKRYGTVTVLSDRNAVEVTTFRKDGAYSDGRRPDVVVFSSDVRDDLARRDFTVNAIAYDVRQRTVIDCHGGLADLRARVIRAVGDPCVRFQEDALRMLRAIRLGAELGFAVAPATLGAIESNHEAITRISWERIRDEFSAMIVSPRAGDSVRLAERTRLLEHILPELQACVATPTGPPGAGTVFDHSLKVADIIEPALHLRLAALLHDVGKPATMTRDASGAVRFFGHEKAGAMLARQALERLRYPGELVCRVALLIGRHMFTYDPAMKDKGIRRIVATFGIDAIYDLAKLREADRVALGARPGSGDNMAAFLARVEGLMARGPVLSVRDLAVSGHDVMEVLGVPEGPQVGKALSTLLDAVLEDPELNSRERLLQLLRDMKRT